MTTVKNSTPKQFKGRTVTISPGSDILPTNQVRKLLGIRTRYSFNEHLKVLGLFGRKFLNWNDIKLILELQLFLGIKPGFNSREMFVLLQSKGKLESLFNSCQINVNEHLERLKNASQN